MNQGKSWFIFVGDGGVGAAVWENEIRGGRREWLEKMVRGLDFLGKV